MTADEYPARPIPVVHGSGARLPEGSTPIPAELRRDPPAFLLVCPQCRRTFRARLGAGWSCPEGGGKHGPIRVLETR